MAWNDKKAANKWQERADAKSGMIYRYKSEKVDNPDWDIIAQKEAELMRRYVEEAEARVKVEAERRAHEEAIRQKQRMFYEERRLAAVEEAMRKKRMAIEQAETELATSNMETLGLF